MVTVTLFSCLLSSPHFSPTAFSLNSLQFLIYFAVLLPTLSRSFSLTYLCLFARSINHRQQNFCLSSSSSLSWYVPSPLFLFLFLFARCSVPTSSPLLWVVPCDGLTYPKRVSYLTLFYFVYSIVLLVHSQSVVLGTLSDQFRCRSLHWHVLINVDILLSVLCVLRHVSNP